MMTLRMDALRVGFLGCAMQNGIISDGENRSDSSKWKPCNTPSASKVPGGCRLRPRAGFARIDRRRVCVG